MKMLLFNNSWTQNLQKAKFRSSIAWKGQNLASEGTQTQQNVCNAVNVGDKSGYPPFHFPNHLSHWVGFLLMEAKQNSVVKILDIPINKFQIKVELS